jgi:competence protein ComEC
MIVAECYFLDVGQGASQVVALADGSAILIDCGPSAQVLLDLLHQLGVNRIAALLITHNHTDHVGGIPEVVVQYRGAIDRIFFLQDRPAPELERGRFYSFLMDEWQQRNIPEPSPLMRHPLLPWLYSQPTDTPTAAIRIEALFPDFFQNICGQARGEPNATSAILRLHCGRSTILFPGDANAAAWLLVSEKTGHPVTCDILAVSHHGGQIVRSRRHDEVEADFHAAIRPELDHLYGEVVRCRYAIISVGTGNVYDHPLPPHVESLRDAGARVMCTQITRRCCLAQEPLRPGIIPPRWPGRAEAQESRTNKGASRNVACAGTVLVQIGPDEVVVDRWQEHQQAIDEKLSRPEGHPLCRQ